MTYELAKQLKDAGFKQDYILGQWACEHGLDKLMENSCNCYGEMLFYAPSLSELIEACGDCLSHIKKWGGYWWAVSHCGHPEHEFGGNNLEEQGVTPEESVAKLWLELNKKI